MKNLKILENKIFVKWLNFSALFSGILILAFFITLTLYSWPGIKANGISFLWGKEWDPVNGHFGMLPFLIGTLITSFLSLILSIPFAMAAAIFLGEYFPKGSMSTIFRNIIELLAAIPSVVYGLWGLFIVSPIVQKFEMKIHVAPIGVGIFTASLILAIMLIPYSVSIVRQVISMTPLHLKEAAYALGGTQTEVIRKVVLPYCRSGISAGFLLALGRALGETMAVTMLIGNTHSIPTSIFSPSNTMASVIANEFTEAIDQVYSASLVEMGLLLFVVTTIINLIGREVIKRVTVV